LHYSTDRLKSAVFFYPKFTKLTKKETKMQKFTDVFAETIPFLCKTAIAFALAFLIGGIAYCFADEPTDWHDNTLSEQIQQEARAKAKAQWREENGIYQANLTPQVNADMYRYVEQKQAEINRTWSK
jgi:hypothetical protein